MRTTIDSSGRLVIPESIREKVGLVPGEVEMTVDGNGIRIEPVAAEGVVEQDDRLVVPAGGVSIDDALVQGLRDADQR